MRLKAERLKDKADTRTPPPPPRHMAPDPAAAAALGLPRDRTIAVLQVLALAGLVLFHTLRWGWLPMLVPSMPLLFAVGGFVVARGLDTSPLNPWPVLRDRVFRLLPPLWALGLLIVPLMLLKGWTYNADTGVGSPLSWRTLPSWVVPVTEPPGSAWGEDWTSPLWYLPACLWFLVLTPSVLWLWRRWPVRTLAIPYLALLAAATGAWAPATRSGEVLLDLATFASCWVLGFAHHDNKIRSMPLARALPVGGLLMLLGFAYTISQHGPKGTSVDIDQLPLATALWGTGFVLLLLRLCPDLAWLGRRPMLDSALNAVNTRALTIYLWNNPAIFLAVPLVQLLPFSKALEGAGIAQDLQFFVVSLLLLTVAVLAFDWVENVAVGGRRLPTPSGFRTRESPPPTSRSSRRRRSWGASWVRGGAVALTVALGLLVL